MSSEAKTNVHIAASNLSLADVDAALAKPQPKPNQRLKFRAPVERPVSIGDAAPDNHHESGATSRVDSIEEFVVVSIPSVTTGGDEQEAGRPIEPKESRLQRLPQSIHPVPFVEQLKKLAEKSKGVELQNPSPVVHEDQLVGLNVKIPGVPKADISERPDDWLPDHDSGEKRSTKKAKPLDTPKQAFSDLTERVLEQFPLGPSSVLLIADVDGHSSGDSVAYQLAVQLGTKNVGRVLLIDSHFEQRKLSERLALGFEIGLADILSTNKSLDETLCETECTNLDFLPVGTDRMCKRRCPDSTWLADNIRSLKGDYQFVIVSAGNVFHRSTALWGQHCDASYMAIELGSTNQTIAKSGVIRLQQFGARLMGCVVTDVAA